MYVLSVVFGSVIKIEYHKSGQECLEQKLKEIKKIIVESAEFEWYRFITLCIYSLQLFVLHYSLL